MRRNYVIRGLITAVAWLGLFTASVPGVRADIVPKKINFSGRLTDASGNNVTSAVSMTFKIFDALTGGTELWSETQVVSVSTGVYSVQLGSVTALSTAVFTSGSGTFLQVQAGADAAMTPRITFSAVPYTFTAQNFLSALPVLDLLTVTPVNTSITNAATYTVPAGKLFVFNISAPSCTPAGGGNTQCHVSVTGSHTGTAVGDKGGMAGAGDILASTGTHTIKLHGGLLNFHSAATLVLQNLAASGGTYSAPASQNFYFQARNTDTNCAGTLSIGGLSTGDPGGILPAGQTLTNNRACIVTINGWLK